MKLCWSLETIPELSHLTPEQRREAIRSSVSKVRRLWLVVWPLIMGILTGGFAFIATGVFVGTSRGPETAVGIGIGCAVVGVVVFHQYQFLRIRSMLRLQIMRELAGERLPACLRCHYDLRGSTESRCPECGAPVIVAGSEVQND
ncbi:MAG: hypothetical protein JSV91_13195 [Phycisphaerales bacterium]|nr:MAG: hypothetical protein JSV91_13195 [Phycisphaerales bacterium]